MINRAFYIKIIGDALIPLFGFFLWDWSLYFIVLFYILDLVVGEVLMHLKTRKIKNYSENIIPKNWIINGIVSGVLLFLLIVCIHIAFLFIHSSIQFKTEILAFLSYKELGIQQGYILVPLVVFMGYATYTNEFIRPRVFAFLEANVLWKKHLLALAMLIGFVVVCALIANLFQLPEWIYLCLILIVTTGYSYSQYRKSQR